ncbi:MAG: hypothetical protein OEM66_03495, partial [Acidimicrobiia bacterium]|nr:hypothetical protein [Acidimicrobiia bacterium]
MGGVMDGFVEGVGADADRSPAQVVLADVDGIESGVPCLISPGQEVLLPDRVIHEFVFGDEVLAVNDVLDQPIGRIPGVHGEEAVLAG